MNRSTSSAQLLTAANPSTTARTATSAPYLRALMLSGLAVLGSVGAAFAQGAPSVKAKQADAQALYLTVENPAQKLVQVKVVSLANYTSISNEVNHKASYGVQLNFKGVPAGAYAVLLRVGHEHYRYNVQVTAQPQTAISVQGLAPATPTEVVASR